MRNFKRILALVLAVVMIAGTFATLSAAGEWYAGAVSHLEEKGIAAIGTNANKKISRNEFVFWVAKIESRQLIDSAWNDEIAGTEFSDVTDDHHKAAIAYAARRHFIEGNGDGTFSPDKVVTLAEASAVIVRLMGYADKVAFSVGEEWKFNNMQVAQTYVKAFDAKFLANTKTYDPDYELSYGEAAYLLATLLNFTSPTTPIVTADRINLGDALDGITGSTFTTGFYITKMDRALYTPHTSLTDLSATRPAMSHGERIHAGDAQVPIYSNLINEAAESVVAVSFDGLTTKKFSGVEFMKLLRVSLGLAATRNKAEEEPEINAYQYCDVGSVVYLTIDQTKADKPVTKLSVSSSSVIVDTYLQAEYAISDNGVNFGFGMNSNYAKNQLGIPADEISQFLGWTVREIVSKDDAKVKTTTKKESMKPVLPATYTEDLAATWTNIARNASGTVTSATLNFQGKTYKYSGANTAAFKVYAAGNMTDAKSADWAVTNLISAAQGECLAVFNDIDGNGTYDNVVVKESAPFLYVGKPNVAGATSDAYDVYSSVSNGKVVYPDHKMKGYNIGAVILDKTVTHSAGEANDADLWDYRTDGYKLLDGDDKYKTGKVQLVLRASNMHNMVDGKDNSDADPFTPERYTVVDLAEFSVGIIESIDAYAVEGYFKASIKNVDGSVKEVLIPETPKDLTKFNVTVGGATAEYTFDSSAWLSFVTEAKADIIANGIVSGVADPALRQATAAWMTGRYVQYADKDGEVVIISKTDAATKDTGFVLGVEKTETGDNTYKVKLAKTGEGVVADEKAYLKVVDDGGVWVLDNPVITGGTNNARRYDYPNYSFQTFNTQYWGVLYGFRWTNGKNAANGCNAPAAFFSTGNPSDNRETTPLTRGEYTFGPASPLYNAINDPTSGNYNAWTVRAGVDADGNAVNYVYDQTGTQVYFQKKTVNRFGAAELWSEEVRGSASAIFDWANYDVYSQIFDKGLLINPDAEAAAKAAPGSKVLGSDLIYVTVWKDANSTYLKAGDGSVAVNKMLRTGEVDAFLPVPGQDTTNPVGQNCLYVVTGQGYAYDSAKDSWLQVEGKVQIGDVTETSRTPATGSYTATYDFVEGINPYYYRVWNNTKKIFEYEIRFESVTKYTGVTGTANAIVDETKTLLIPLMIKDSDGNTVQVKLTDSNKTAYQAKIDAGTYYVDQKTKNLFKVESDTIYYVTDKDGKIVYEEPTLDYSTATVVGTPFTGRVAETELKFWEKDGKKLLSKYDTLGFKEAPKSTPGWFPGLYTFDFVEDGKAKTLQIPFYSKVVMLTPCATGFSSSEMTVEEAAKQGVFAVSANFVEDEGKVGMIAVIGEPSAEFSSSSTPSTPSTEPDKNLLVYLSADATTTTQSTQFGKKWIVMTNGSAYAIPSGENVGNIYREYNTYEGTQATSVSLDVVGGHWYKVNKDGKILSDETSVTYETIADLTLTAGTNVLVETDIVLDGDTMTVKALGTIETESFIGFYDEGDTRTFVTYDVDNAKYVVDADAEFAGAAYDVVDAAFGRYTDVVSGTNVIYLDDVAYTADDNFLRTETSAALKNLQTATVVSATAAGGTKIAFTSDLSKATDVSGKDFEFFYRNADQTVLYKAGDSTTVTIATPAAYNNAIKTQKDAYDKAKSAYDNALTKTYLSKSRLAYYENDFNEKANALKEKKDSLLDTYYNGQFWNVPNSPFMKYQVKSQQTYQSADAKLTFNYIVVNGVYCVFSDEFVLS